MKSTQVRGKIFDIQRFSLHDGPGIRTTVFMKGCPLSCRWCHNPEGMSYSAVLRYFPEKCIGCQRCVAACRNGVHSVSEAGHKLNRNLCENCGQCAKVCPSGALTLCGYELTPSELCSQVLSDAEYWRRGGGVTFSGGEPLCQVDFVCEAANLIKAEVPEAVIAVDTCGFVTWDSLCCAAEVTDLFLYDIKAVSDGIHTRATGQSNKLILENLRRLDRTGKRIWIRTPVVPGYNSTSDEIKRIAGFVSELENVECATLIPYHSAGISKYRTVGIDGEPHSFEVPTDEEMRVYRSIFAEHGITVTH